MTLTTIVKSLIPILVLLAMLSVLTMRYSTSNKSKMDGTSALQGRPTVAVREITA